MSDGEDAAAGCCLGCCLICCTDSFQDYCLFNMRLGTRSNAGSGGCCGSCFKKSFDRDEFADERRRAGRKPSGKGAAGKADKKSGHESTGTQPAPTQEMQLVSSRHEPEQKAENSAMSSNGDAPAPAISESSLEGRDRGSILEDVTSPTRAG